MVHVVSKGVYACGDSNRRKNLQREHYYGCAFPASMAVTAVGDLRGGCMQCLSDWNDNANRKITNEMKPPKSFDGMWAAASRSKIYTICFSAALCMEMQCWSNVEGVHALILFACAKVGGKEARRKNYNSLPFIFVLSFVSALSFQSVSNNSVVCCIYCYRIFH